MILMSMCVLFSWLLPSSANQHLMDAVALYGGSNFSFCSGEREGVTSQDAGFIDGYNDLDDALKVVENSEKDYSHFTICLNSESTFVLSATVNLSSSVRIVAASVNGSPGDKAKVHCNLEPTSDTGYTAFFYGSEKVELVNLQFEGCPSPIGLELVENIFISHCTFQYFTEAVFDIFNSAHVYIFHSHFLQNSGQGLSTVASRGNTGALAIGFRNSPPSLSEVSISIMHTTFLNNTAYTSSFVLAIENLVYTGRGGGIGIFMSHSFNNVSVVISDCVFRENTAALFGGGLFYLIARESYHHELFIRNSTFDSNVGYSGASGVMLANPVIEQVETDSPAVFRITGSQFWNHTGVSGGAIALFPSYLAGKGSQMIVSDCNFENNKENSSNPYAYGAAIAISEINTFSDRSSLSKHQIIDCLFVNNTGENGIVDDGYAPVMFSGTNRFIDNKGTPLKVVGALVELAGSMEFINNTVASGAALVFSSFAQARLTPGLRILFEGNIGRLGAAIFVDNPTFHMAAAYNPLCFFVSEDETQPPELWDNITITTRRNSALEGSTLYIRRLESCSWTSFAPPFSNITAIRDWPIWNISESNRNTGFEGHMKTDASTLFITTHEVSTWPGQKFQVTVSVMDQFDLLTSVTAEYIYNSERGGKLVLQPELETITSKEEFTQNFSCVTSSQTASGTVQVSNGLQSKAFQTQLLILNTFKIDLVPCPGGYTVQSIEVRDDLWGCACDSELKDLLFCSEDQDTIFIRSGLWATYVPPEDGHNIKFYPCPPGYCSCVSNVITDVTGTMCMYFYSHSSPDLQCTCGRKGILCGECVNSSSVTVLFNKCSDCKKGSPLLISALIIADVVVFITIALVNVPLPEWIYPFLFYIQMAPYTVQYFPFSFDRVGNYLYFIGSATSFYFVYDFCVYDGMTSLEGVALRYLPIITATATLLPMLGFKVCISKRRSTIKHHGVWWIILLSFSNAIYTSMSILNCPSITDNNGNITPRWFMNGEVQCFSGLHLALGLIAMVCLLLSLLLILSTAAIPLYRRRHKDIQWVARVSDALSFSYRESYEWWGSVELVRRALLTLVLLAFPRNTIVVILILAITLAIQGHVQPYKHYWTNICEVVVLVDFIILLALRETKFFIDEYFRFPSDTGDDGCGNLTPKSVAIISWALLPLYYFPVLLLITLATAYISYTLWMSLRKAVTKEPENFQLTSLHQSLRELSSAHGEQTTYASLNVRRGLTHGLASVIRHKNRLRNRNLSRSANEHLTDPFLTETERN